MEEFNKLFEDMGVKGVSMGESLNQVTVGTINTAEVGSFLFYVRQAKKKK